MKAKKRKAKIEDEDLKADLIYQSILMNPERYKQQCMRAFNLLAPQPAAQLQLAGSAETSNPLPTAKDWTAWEAMEDEG